MSKQDCSYLITKLYKTGNQYTTKVVGRISFNDYITALLDSMDDTEDGMIRSIIVSSLGRRDEDIKNKDKINKIAFHNHKRYDYYNRNLSNGNNE